MIIPSAISQEILIFKANYLPEKKNMNSYVGGILLLVQYPLAFTSVHNCLNHKFGLENTDQLFG